MDDTLPRLGATRLRAVSLVVVRCGHQARAAGGASRCDGELVHVPPHWSTRVKKIPAKEAASGWGLTIQCPACRRWNELLISGKAA